MSNSGKKKVFSFYTTTVLPLIVVPASAKNESFSILIDTGASSNLIDKEFIQKNPELVSTTKVSEEFASNTIIGVNGMQSDCYTTSVTIPIKDKYQEYTTLCSHSLVYDLASIKQELAEQTLISAPLGIVIGHKFLQEHNATIDYSKGELTLYDLPCK